MTYRELMSKVEEYYGDAGVCALESADITETDTAKGLDHCLERIAPALEEELMARGEMG